MRYLRTLFLSFVTVTAVALSSMAGESDVTGVSVRAEGFDTYAFSVTVRHADTGWEHYADRWEVLTLEGEVLATRTLLHPHVNEQPFTRSLGGVRVPAGTVKVRVRSHDEVHDYGGQEFIIDLATGDTALWSGS